ncbi:metallophosphoesterase [Nesterenkonia sp.]|uniref:metallophosphoesterase n=1 Tax=Nesterenkonia sp. TaxID=704201 RepID=UPI00263568E9|nr:metallophosphoesterase [Nesterenkonia sp.]
MSTPLVRASVTGAGALTALGAAALVYANRVELTRFTLRRAAVPVAGLPGPLRILHISDIHYVPGQRKKLRWLQRLGELEPDLVVDTGDNLSRQDAVPEVLDALAPLLQFPGCFVPGSNDYYAPRWKNPLSYLAGPSHLSPDAQTLPTGDLFSAFEQAGWANLTNAHSAAEVAGLRVEFSGVDDPHLNQDEFSGWTGYQDPSLPRPDLRIGVAHAPVRRVLQTFADSGADLVLAGHTHGGQVCLPSLSGRGRALVTNCDLPAAHAKGLHQVPASDGGRTWVHVSAGIGTSAKAPIRFFCPPEATLLTLTPA